MRLPWAAKSSIVNRRSFCTMWPYFSVVLRWMWPARSCTAGADPPRRNSSVTKKCRRSWKRNPSIPTFF
jgi:hypothetical protein